MGRVRFSLASGFLLLVAPAAARAQCATDSGFAGDVARVLYANDVRWYADRPLREGYNAHRTNTKEEFAAALKGDYNWLEGDVRVEINHDDRLEMRHDEIHERGDNLTLDEWLAKGKATGRGLKLDIKETALMPLLLERVAKSGVPDERLMFNLGDRGMAEFGAEIRKRFPNAILAINPTHARDGRTNDGPLEDWQVTRALALAATFGGPATFVLHEGEATPESVAALQAAGPVSIWGDVSDPAKRNAELRAIGVDGMIDLAKEHAPGLGDHWDAVINTARTWFDRH